MTAYFRETKLGIGKRLWEFVTEPLVFWVTYQPEKDRQTDEHKQRFFDEQLLAARHYLAENPGATAIWVQP